MTTKTTKQHHLDRDCLSFGLLHLALSPVLFTANPKPFRASLLLGLAVLLSLAVLSGCTIKEAREDVYNELDRFRVLGIDSSPAQPAPGESASFSVLAYDPQERPLSYEWSWCPAPGAPQDGFRCALAEEDFAALWWQVFPGDPPPYSLGTAQTASFSHFFTKELVEGFCENLAERTGASAELILQCIDGIQPSVSVRVSAGEEELVAWREMSLIYEDLPEEERNHNPDVRGELTVTRVSDDVMIPPGGTLHRGELYKVEAGFDIAQAEMFLPEAKEGLPEPEPRRENIEMRWLITAGTTSFIEQELGPDTRFDGIEELDDAGSDTDFAAGFTEFEDFIRNYWYFPVNDGTPSGPVHLFLVARDERDGIGWASYTFSYLDETP